MRGSSHPSVVVIYHLFLSFIFSYIFGFFRTTSLDTGTHARTLTHRHVYRMGLLGLLEGNQWRGIICGCSTLTGCRVAREQTSYHECLEILPAARPASECHPGSVRACAICVASAIFDHRDEPKFPDQQRKSPSIPDRDMCWATR